VLSLIISRLKGSMIKLASHVVCVMFGWLISYSHVQAADTIAQSKEQTSKQAIAKLSLKHVSFSQHQEDYLNAITDVLVAEQKGVWKDLPETKNKPSEDSKVHHPFKDNLTLLEASLYHYFGMEKEAEKRYQSVVKKKSSHLPTAYLLLARYYHEQEQHKDALKWLSRIEDTELTKEQLSFKYFYQLESLARLGKRKQAIDLLNSLDEEEWLPVASYNVDRMKMKGSQQKNAAETDEEDSGSWFGSSEKTLSPLMQELEAQKFLQEGMDATKDEKWSQAVESFKRVPGNTLRTVEARRWLAWSLMKDDQVESAANVWRVLTRSPAYQVMDAHAMAATTTEQLGDKARALAWFERGIGFYSEQVDHLGALRNEAEKGEWFQQAETSNDSFWAPVQVSIPATEALYLWAEDVWLDDEFQEVLADHRDLTQLTELLTAKRNSMESFDFMVETREQAYQKSLKKLQNLDAKNRMAAYTKEAKQHTKRVDEVSDYKDVVAVGTKEQLINQALIERVKANLNKLSAMKGYARKHKTESYELRYQHLSKIHFWELNESFPSNFRRYQREVNGLNDRLVESVAAKDSMQKAKVYAPKRFEGYSKKIDRLNEKLVKTIATSKTLQEKLRQRVITLLDNKLKERQQVAQSYLEQCILASARLRDEIAYELGAAPSNSKSLLANNSRIQSEGI